MRDALFTTRITELFGIRHPILCGGLQWLADARYVSAVVRAGGMGFLTCLSFPGQPERFRKEVQRCREMTGGRPFGVSVSIARRPDVIEVLTPFVDVIVDEGVRFVETSGNNPNWLLPRLKSAGCTVIHKASSVRHAASAARQGVDAVTVISAEAGGHTGRLMLGQIVQGPLAARDLDVPLALAGGMGTGRHLVAALSMGADAMMLGTRMLVATEIWAHRAYKEHVVSLNEQATRIVMASFGKQHRVLDNEAARQVAAMEASGVDDFAAFRPHLAGAQVRAAYASGDWSRGMIDLGPSVAFADRIETVERIFDRILDEAVEALEGLDRVRTRHSNEEARHGR